MEINDLVFVGIKRNAMGLNRSTGAIVWQTPLSGGFGNDFVHVVLDAENLYATNSGEIFCLDPMTGQIRWHNKLKGMGTGLASIAVRGGTATSDEILAAEYKQRQRSAAAAASTTGA